MPDIERLKYIEELTNSKEIVHYQEMIVDKINEIIEKLNEE